MKCRPPALARWILERALPRDVREDVTGDLDELFRRARERRGPLRARLRYWRQAASFSLQFSVERLHTWHREADMSTGLSWIDFKLGARMLVRYPGLTLVSVAGMAVGIAIAAGASAITCNLMDPPLPLEQGERVVSIVTLDIRTSNAERRTLRDFSLWRTLRSLEDVGPARRDRARAAPRGRAVAGPGPHPSPARRRVHDHRGPDRDDRPGPAGAQGSGDGGPARRVIPPRTPHPAPRNISCIMAIHGAW